MTTDEQKNEQLEKVDFAKGEESPHKPQKMNQDFLEAVYDVPVKVTVHLGSVQMPISDLVKLGRGAVIPLNKRVGEPIEIYVNNRVIARGEVVLVDENIGITITELLKTENLSD